MNKLLDRYLAAIGRELPRRHAEEITAELKDALLSKIEDREAELARPMTDKEIEQLLIDFGHPLIVAASYRKTQYLIGPDLFPMWFATLRFVLVFWAAILLISLFIAAITTPSATPLWALQKAGGAFWPGFLFVFGVITLVFAVNERMGKYRFKLAFNPRLLPPPRARGRKPAQVIGEMVMGAVALVWWVGLIKFRAIMPIPSFLGVHLASTWDAFRAPIAAYIVAELIINSLELLRPGWTRLNASLSLAKALAGCALIALVLETGHWVEIVAPSLSIGVREMIQQGFDHGLRIGLIATVVLFVIKAGADVLRLWRSLRRDGGQAGNGASTAAQAR